MPPRDALAERDNNTMSQNGKRAREVVDLTTEDDDDTSTSTRGAKAPRLANASGSFPTPPTSSARSSGYESVYNAPSSSYGPADGRHSEAERESWLADDSNELIAGSQDDADGSEQLIHYGDIQTKIVGIQYYNGHSNSGEQILMRREPGNPHDSNAIRIDNVAGSQIGHIPRKMASKIARYMDSHTLHMEGQLSGTIGHYDCPLTVHMYGPDSGTAECEELKEQLKADRLDFKALKALEKQRKTEEKERLAAARRAAAASKSSQYTNQQLTARDGQNGQEFADLLEASQRIAPREISGAAEKFGTSEEDLKKMPMAAAPDAIQTEMLPYQRQALQWLIDQENPKDPGAGSNESTGLWTKSGGRYTNLATNFTTSERPQFIRGGILADDMGLGKTLEMISLLVSKEGKGGTTLILSPLSVMSNWSGQIAAHIKGSHALKVYTYHGSGRVKMNAKEFEQYDVVISTYQTLAVEFSSKGSSKQPERKQRSTGLYSVNWRRIIADEGHQIRNPKAKGTAAACALMAQSRWVLTGTPIINSLKDLYSILKFLGITGGLDQLEIFNRVLVRPLKLGEESAAVLLKLIMKTHVLRRKKEMDFIDLKLPPLEEFVHRVEFTKTEKERYEALQAQAKGMLTTIKNNEKGTTVSHLLEILLRMRQCCNHWSLCKERVSNLMAQLEKSKTVALTPENKKALQELLQIKIETHDDCAICLDTLHQPVITACGHSFGNECITKVMETFKKPDVPKCPMCRAELKDESFLIAPANECGDENADDDLDLTQSSSKLEALMSILDAINKGNGNKVVIFSQWTSFLDIVQARLERDGYKDKYCRLDGTLSATQRDQALQRLENNKDTTILLASLGVCSVGLNLTAANHVILSDTWWAPAIEDQAVDRVHRLGQKKETRVFRLVVDQSIEEQTLEVQKNKRKLMAVAFSEKANKRDKARSGRLDDIQKLLSM